MSERISWPPVDCTWFAMLRGNVQVAVSASINGWRVYGARWGDEWMPDTFERSFASRLAARRWAGRMLRGGGT